MTIVFRVWTLYHGAQTEEFAQTMTHPALQHSYPQWEPPETDPYAPIEEYREVWCGRMRIVRNRKRARKLKRRGVPMWDLRERGRHAWAWFVEETNP